ncbi:L,D-transpeptidase [Zavarzinia sp. CC-PAN008]|uniref:L,D-transpeptidase n=1 Tax=Zavarzinia sp. CC-PAN008 TaxID=3243332 RepID=UPI003F743321
MERDGGPTTRSPAGQAAWAVPRRRGMRRWPVLLVLAIAFGLPAGFIMPDAGQLKSMVLPLPELSRAEAAATLPLPEPGGGPGAAASASLAAMPLPMPAPAVPARPPRETRVASMPPPGERGIGRPAGPSHLPDLIGTQAYWIESSGEPLTRQARDNRMGFIEMVLANKGVNNQPRRGRQLLVSAAHILPPGPRNGIVVNLGDQRLYHFREDGSIDTYPVAIGKVARSTVTPTGATAVTLKRRRPTWIPTADMRRRNPNLPASVGPGPHNPMGLFAMNLGWAGYRIHGTNEPSSIGKIVSSGCIRMYPEDIEALFEKTPTGTPVAIVNEPVKLGWEQGELYLEAHPPMEVATGWARGQRPDLPEPANLRERIGRMAGPEAGRIAWDMVKQALDERTGIPLRITRPAAATMVATPPT